MRQPPAIETFGPGGFRVGGVWRPGSLLILDDVPRPWRPTSLAQATVEDFRAILDAGPGVSEFVLLGTGAEQALPAREIRDALRSAGFGLEFMATPRAAREWGVLASEGRRVAGAFVTV
ncbi:MAG TPA: Mth938-like domain-containing protein [Caulobacteraceae bacterium]|jgi:uncharacterized protein|nr:Mth938-like domain-containing protein [Caulobacteraceae bacterium]